MREPMDAISEPTIQKVVVAKAAQVAYTDGIVNNTCGYYIDQDPGPILVVMPTLELAEAWSKDRLAPMLRDTPVLTMKVGDPKSESENTIRQKVFPGGRITVIGANAPSGLSARPIRIVVGDEVDRWPLSAGIEGDPLALAAKRQQTFWNRKTLIGSTPVKRDTSVIWREYLASDQRRYFVPCHACEHMQTLRWEQVRWDKRGADEEPDPQFGAHKPETAHFVCEHCGSIWNDGDRHAAIQAGEWRAARPTQNTAGFHVPGFLSPWLAVEDIVREFLMARNDPQLLQVWINTVLGEPWDGDVEKIEATGLIGRCENYTRDTIPDAALILVAGVDVQVNRLEIQVLAFGPNEECWVAAYETIRGDPQHGGVWKELDELLCESFHTDIGREMRIRATCVDSGGPTTAQVMAYARVRSAQRIYAIKGADGPRPIWPRQESRSKKNAGRVFIVGVDTAKDAIYGRLTIARPGPGRIHFPIGFEQTYFDQLTSEQVTTKRVNSKPRRVWVLPKGRRNEALDTFVYALAARHSLRVRLDRPAQALPATAPPVETAPVESMPLPEAPDAPAPMMVPPMVQHSLFTQPGWMGRRGRGWFDR